MKIAFISDIHSNIEAFQAVLKFLETKKINQIYIAGDIIGYYYYAAEVINLCMSSDNIFCIRGNHDRNFLDAIYSEPLMEKLTSKYDFWTLSQTFLSAGGTPLKSHIANQT